MRVGSKDFFTKLQKNILIGIPCARSTPVTQHEKVLGHVSSEIYTL